MSSDFIYCKIIEYEISWPHDILLKNESEIK